MKPLKEFYEENGLTPPKNLLPREEWLYSKLSEDMHLVVQGLEAQSQEMDKAKGIVEGLTLKVWRHNKMYWVAGGLAAGIAIALVSGVFFTINNDTINQLQRENAALRNTDWVKQNQLLEAENAALKEKLNKPWWKVW